MSYIASPDKIRRFLTGVFTNLSLAEADAATVADNLTEADQWIDRLKATRRRAGVREILMPGEREFRKKEESLREGLRIGDGVYASLRTIEQEYPAKLLLKDCLIRES